MAENKSIADRLLDALVRMKSSPREIGPAMEDLGRAESDLQALVEDVRSTEMPEGIEDAADVVARSLQGLDLLAQAARKIRLYASTRKDAAADEAEALARKGMELIDAVKIHNEERVQALMAEEQYELGSGLKGWKPSAHEG